MKTIHILVELEHLFHTGKLWDIGTESYLGGKTIRLRVCITANGFLELFGRPPVLIKEFVQLTNSVLNYGDSRMNLPTTTKLLHFMLPDLFPIFDSNVCKALFGNDRIEDYNKCHAYIFALQDFLKYEPEAKALSLIAQDTKLPLLRMIDLVLFQEGIDNSNSINQRSLK